MKIKQNLFITNIDDYLGGHYTHCFNIAQSDMLGTEWIKIGTTTIDVNVDKEMLTARGIKVIEEAETKEIAEHEMKMRLLKEKKDSFLALEHKPR